MSKTNPRRVHTMSLQAVVTADEYYPDPNTAHVAVIGAGKGFGASTTVGDSAFDTGEAVLIHSIEAHSIAGDSIIIHAAVSGAAADVINIVLAANEHRRYAGPYFFNSGFHVEKLGLNSVDLVISYSIVHDRE